MKFAALVLAAVAAVAGVSAAADSAKIHVRVHVNAKGDDICYKKCPDGQWCARGTQQCRAPKAGSTECFNYATAKWIPKCDKGFECVKGKCEQSKNNGGNNGGNNNNNDQSPGVPNGPICYDKCDKGKWCARGTHTCRAPKAGSTECFDLSQGLWIPKCGPGFSCKEGKCA